jgi:DNA-binding LacI/PurR family transcriptional regulator
VSADVRTRVEQAAARLGYRPNRMARGLRSARANAVALVVPTTANPFFLEIARGAQSVFTDAGLITVLSAIEPSTDLGVLFDTLVDDHRLDGVIFVSANHQSPLPTWGERPAHLVLVDEYFRGAGVPFVGADNRGGAALAAEHVLARGHERVAVIAGPRRQWTSRERVRGYADALARAGVAEPVVVHGDYGQQSGYDAAAALFGPGGSGRPARPTAVLAANDLMAIGAMQYLREHGIEVGRDVAVTGFDDIPSASIVTPGLTTVRQPALAIGRAAGECVTALLDGREPAPMTSLPTELVVRDSDGGSR